jgi:CDP-2,3-bis-(O-geranylgeranyl)-sn-glycerol synthase
MGLLTALWFIIPAYVANGGACGIHNNKPVDGGRYAWDGRRIIGDGVTWGGYLAGTSLAVAASVLQYLVAKQHFPIADAGIAEAAALGFLLGFGALTGDLVESFFKRRLGIERGRPLPLLDQWDFLIGALLFSALIVRIPLVDIAILFVITPFVHLGTNYLSNKAGLKGVPW